jgi:hypothetical protein
MTLRRVLVVLVMGALSPLARADSIPPFNQTRDIYLSSLSGWYLRIDPDGGGYLQFGQGGGDGGRIAKGTFSFSEIYEKLAAQAKVAGDSHHELWVSFHDRRDPTGCVSRLWNNRDYMQSLMTLAFAKAQLFDRKREVEILQKHPFLPDPHSPE